jgi:hypothetical protein
MLQFCCRWQLLVKAMNSVFRNNLKNKTIMYYNYFKMKQKIAFVFALLFALFLTGCNNSALKEVRGTVEYDGQPLAVGSITFLPQLNTQGMSTSCSVTNGTFHLSRKYGVVAGDYDIVVTGYDGKPVKNVSLDDESETKNNDGQPLFPDYTFVHHFDSKNDPLNIIVPKNVTKK